MKNPMTPNATPVDQVLQKSGPLKQLLERVRISQACLQVVYKLMPPGLHSHVQAGPWDDAGWTLLAANAAVAAKLRQWQPDLETALRAHGHAVAQVRVKIVGHGP